MTIASILTFTLIVLVSTVRMDTFTNSMGLEKFVEFYGHLQGIENNGPTAQQMFSKHDLNQDAQLDTQELKSVLVSHFASSPVPVSDAAHDHDHDPCEPPSSSESWGYGILASVIISVISIVGAAIIPLSSRGRGYVLEILISFAVGALIGDAVLHLLPEVLGVHSHGEEEEGEEEAEEEDKSYLWPLLLVLAALLFFYAVERLINYLHNRLSGSDHHHHHTHSHGLAHPPEHEAKVHHAELRESISSTELISVPVSKAPEAGTPEKKFQSTKEQLQAVKAIGWLNLISDAFHNFTDGLAIGAAFSVSTKLGLGTAIAVGFHEIPQELGDFALLLHSGFTFTQCILFNLASACFAILGTIIGLGIGEETESASKWILSFTAGGFLYIALADMMPELHHKTGKLHMLVQMIGMVVGMVVLLIIAIFESETTC